MGMLMRRHYNDNTAEGATPKEVAPKPTHEIKPEVEKDMPEEKNITRNDIMRMNVATVRAYAKSQGIEGVDDMSGAELKRILDKKLFEESE